MPAPKSNNYSQNPLPQGGGPGQNPAQGAPTARPAGVPLGLPGVGGARAPGPRADGIVEDHRNALLLGRQARVVHRE